MKKLLLILLFLVGVKAQAACPASLFNYSYLSVSGTVNLIENGVVAAIDDANGGSVFFTSLTVKNGSSDVGVVKECVRIPINTSATDQMRRDMRNNGILSMTLNYKFGGSISYNSYYSITTSNISK